MKWLNVYSSAPLSPQVASAFLHLRRQGTQIVVRPLAELPTGPHPPRRRSALVDERNGICQQLATIGLKLDRFENGTLRPDAGEEQGLRAERDSLQARLRGVEAALRAPAGG